MSAVENEPDVDEIIDLADASIHFESVPVAVLPEVESFAGFKTHDAAGLAVARGALDQIRAYTRPALVHQDLWRATAAIRTLLAQLSEEDVEVVSGDNVDALTPIQDYFAIRTAPTDSFNTLVHITRVFAMVLEDVCNAPLAGSDIDALVKAMSAALGEFSQGDASGEVASIPPIDLDDRLHIQPDDVLSDQQMWYRRWIVAHQVHAVFNVLAAIAVRQATEFIHQGVSPAACERITKASVFVEAFGPARAYALCLPPVHYQTVLRQSMLPPCVPVALSGRMHIEYKVYRKSIDALLAALPMPVAELARRDPELAFARERLMDADMSEAERHICLVWTMIGNDKSLVQSTRTEDNALGALRLIRDRRLAQIEPFIRFGVPH